jgi:hypothetical protein
MAGQAVQAAVAVVAIRLHRQVGERELLAKETLAEQGTQPEPSLERAAGVAQAQPVVMDRQTPEGTAAQARTGFHLERLMPVAVEAAQTLPLEAEAQAAEVMVLLETQRERQHLEPQTEALAVAATEDLAPATHREAAVLAL